ncbi:MAG: hypothetical protein WD078_08485 [Woeseia sp.]
MKTIPVFVVALLLIGCDQAPPETADAPDPAPAKTGADRSPAVAEHDRLATVLAAQPEDTRARYVYRNPEATLKFFGIEPGMTVVEALPGGAWYSRILLPYLGSEGRLIGANYAGDMWPKFGFFEQDFIDSMATWTTDWPEQAAEWRGDDGATVSAFTFGSLPARMENTADAVLLIRAMHNLARFESDGGFLTAALQDVYRVLKPGGIVGVVQHEARPEMPDEWATGANGYLKKDFLVERMEAAGLEFVADSDINANPADQPTVDDAVWRLPPSFNGSQDDAAQRAAMEEIGESNRMTLKFRKPE